MKIADCLILIACLLFKQPAKSNIASQHFMCYTKLCWFYGWWAAL